MSKSWQKVYLTLTNFIAKHPDVEIEASHIRLPESVRPEFYMMFNNVKTAFIKQKIPDLLNDTQIIGKNYIGIERELIKLNNLESISVTPAIYRFLHDPIDGLGRDLFDLLFDLLKKNIDNKTFEERALVNIKAAFESLYQIGYEKWVILSLMKLFETDKLFQVSTREFYTHEFRLNFLEKMIVPRPQESKNLLFKHNREIVAFTVPDLLVHSTKVKKYISLRSQIGEAFSIASDASENREWYPIDSIKDLVTGLTLVYLADSHDDISLVADAEKICRPDLIIECRGQNGWYQKEILEKIKLHRDTIKPRLGMFIVSREPVLEYGNKELGEGIQLLSVGFDQTKLEPIIMMMNKKGKGERKHNPIKLVSK